MSAIVLTGGGTAGHCAPCFALVDNLKKDFDEIYYVGSENGPEKNFAAARGVKYFPVPTVKFERKIAPKTFLIPIKLARCVSAAKKTLAEIKPSVVFSKGGYVSLPVVLAAQRLNIPVISHESDLSIGLANKIAAKFSDKFLTAFDETSKQIKNSVSVGIPLDQKLFRPLNKKEVLKEFGFSGDKKVLLVMGGSQGSKALNDAYRLAEKDLLKKYDVICLAGKGKARTKVPDGVFETEFARDISRVYAATDLAISRSGANAVFELISLKIPTLAVPLPKGVSRGDQIENAEFFKSKGLIEILYEQDLSQKNLIDGVDKLNANSNKLISRMEKQPFQDSAAKITRILSEYSR